MLHLSLFSRSSRPSRPPPSCPPPLPSSPLPLSLLVLAVVLSLAVFMLFATSAPAPFAKPEKPLAPIVAEDFPGIWHCRWGAVTCTMYLLASGDYECDWCGTPYVGVWHWERSSGQLWISERVKHADTMTTYAVELHRVRNLNRDRNRTTDRTGKALQGKVRDGPGGMCGTLVRLSGRRHE